MKCPDGKVHTYETEAEGYSYYSDTQEKAQPFSPTAVKTNTQLTLHGEKKEQNKGIQPL
jgi:hypothetical protein